MVCHVTGSLPQVFELGAPDRFSRTCGYRLGTRLRKSVNDLIAMAVVLFIYRRILKVGGGGGV